MPSYPAQRERWGQATSLASGLHLSGAGGATVDPARYAIQRSKPGCARGGRRPDYELAIAPCPATGSTCPPTTKSPPRSKSGTRCSAPRRSPRPASPRCAGRSAQKLGDAAVGYYLSSTTCFKPRQNFLWTLEQSLSLIRQLPRQASWAGRKIDAFLSPSPPAAHLPRERLDEFQARAASRSGPSARSISSTTSVPI
jgi:hypothetical protein